VKNSPPRRAGAHAQTDIQRVLSLTQFAGEMPDLDSHPENAALVGRSVNLPPAGVPSD